MNNDFYVIAIVFLLPLTAGMLVSQKNPYHALVIRGILGAVAALVYALFGAADVALTEALVGTMLSITLYAVAVRSSMSVRLGILNPKTDPLPDELLRLLREVLKPAHLRLELLPFSDFDPMKTALTEKDLHALCLPTEEEPGYLLQTRVRRLHQLLQTEALLNQVQLSYVPVTEEETPTVSAIAPSSNSLET